MLIGSESAQSYWTLWDPMDCSPPGFSVHGILQARILETIPFSRRSSQPRDHNWVSWTAGRFCTIWTTLCSFAQSCPTLRHYELKPARLLCPWEFFRQEYWSGLSCPPPGDLPNQRIKPRSPTLQMDSLPSEVPEKALSHIRHYLLMIFVIQLFSWVVVIETIWSITLK